MNFSILSSAYPADLTEFLMNGWGKITLAEMKRDALEQENGVIFESVTGIGKRMIIGICVTCPRQIEILERIFGLVTDGKEEDWNKTTLLEVLVRTVNASGIGFEDQWVDGKRIAVLLCATAPEPIRIIEEVFEFPPVK